MRFSDEKILEYKAQHKDLMLLEVGDKSAILKRPDRATLGLAMSKGREPLKMIEVVLENCWVDGDEEIKTDTALMYSAMEQMDDIIGKKSSTLKNL